MTLRIKQYKAKYLAVQYWGLLLCSSCLHFLPNILCSPEVQWKTWSSVDLLWLGTFRVSVLALF